MNIHRKFVIFDCCSVLEHTEHQLFLSDLVVVNVQCLSIILTPPAKGYFTLLK